MKVTARQRTVMHAVATVAVVIAAALVWHNLPTPSKVYRPFDVHGELEQQVSGRLFDLTVTGVRTGRQAEVPGRRPVAALGEWVLVDADLVATSQYVLPRAELLIGANTYVPSDRFGLNQLGTELAPLITQRGSWAFDVDPTLLGPSTTLVLRVSSGDTRFDSRLVVSIPFSDAVAEKTLVLTPAEAKA